MYDLRLVLVLVYDDNHKSPKANVVSSNYLFSPTNGQKRKDNQFKGEKEQMRLHHQIALSLSQYKKNTGSESLL